MTSDFDKAQAAMDEPNLREEENLADILLQLGDRIAPSLIAGTHRDQLLQCAGAIPASVAAYPFGFELPMHTDQLRGDLGIIITSRSDTARFFEQRGRQADATSAAAGLAEVIREMQCESSTIHPLVSMLMLEFDVPDTQEAVQKEPGIFLYPKEPMIGGGNVQPVSVMLDAIVSSAGWQAQAAEHRELARIYRKMRSSVRIGSLGVFPSRQRTIRLAIADFQNSSEIIDLLQNIGWNAQNHRFVESLIQIFETNNSFVSMLVHFDLTVDGTGPMLGISFSLKAHPITHPRYWVDDPQAWTPFFDRLRDEKLVLPQKLSALRQWPSDAEMLLGQSGVQIFSRGVHHFKFVLRENQIDEAKAYVSCLLLPTR